MSKITFRADDELIDELETFDASKSEVMRRALRAYLDEHAEVGDVDAGEPSVNDAEKAVNADSIDELIVERVDERVEQLLDERPTPPEHGRKRRSEPQDINVNIALDGDSVSAEPTAEDGRKTTPEAGEDASDAGRSTCPQCGENVGESDVYCPNCGTKSSHRVFCECGDEIRSDWAFCPSCGRRTPAADVLDGT
jgi:predicted transcriptional regulator